MGYAGPMRRSALLLVTVLGCGSPNLGTHGADTSACPDVPAVEVTLTDTPHGFSPQEVLDAANGRGTVTLTWADDDGTTGLTLAFAPTGEPIEADDPAFDPDIPEGTVCPGPAPTQVRIPVEVTLTTDDGRLDERLLTTLTARARLDGAAPFDVESFAILDAPAEALDGSYDPPGWAPTPVTLDLFGAFGDALDVIDGANEVIAQGQGTLWGRSPLEDSAVPAECTGHDGDRCSFLVASYRYGD